MMLPPFDYAFVDDWARQLKRQSAVLFLPNLSEQRGGTYKPDTVRRFRQMSQPLFDQAIDGPRTDARNPYCFVECDQGDRLCAFRAETSLKRSRGPDDDHLALLYGGLCSARSLHRRFFKAEESESRTRRGER